MTISESNPVEYLGVVVKGTSNMRVSWAIYVLGRGLRTAQGADEQIRALIGLSILSSLTVSPNGVYGLNSVATTVGFFMEGRTRFNMSSEGHFRAAIDRCADHRDCSGSTIDDRTVNYVLSYLVGNGFLGVITSGDYRKGSIVPLSQVSKTGAYQGMCATGLGSCTSNLLLGGISQDFVDQARTIGFSMMMQNWANAWGSGPFFKTKTPGVTGTDDFLEGVDFRPNTSHIFRKATGHLATDNPGNRALIKSAIAPANLRSTVRLPDGSTLSKYFKTLADGTQVWAEVKNGTVITNGGLNATPK